jgi:hypothetical protein
MAKNKVVNNVFDYYILPTDSVDQISFIKKNKDDMIQQMVNSIEYAVNNKLPYIEVFQFKNSRFVIILSSKDYLPNLDHALNYCTEKELYELCPKITKLQNILKK